MRRTLLVLILLFTGYQIASSQVFKAGIVAGLSGSQVEGDGYGGYNKLGLIVGGFVNTDLSKTLSAQFEIYYIQKGAFHGARPDKGDYNQFKLNLHYIEIPVVLQYNYKKFKFEIGLYVGKFLSYYVEDEFGERKVNRYPFESFEFGGLIGINYKINDHFSTTLRSSNSLLPIRDFDNLDQNVGLFNKLFNRGWYNVSLNFTVSYQIGS